MWRGRKIPPREKKETSNKFSASSSFSLLCVFYSGDKGKAPVGQKIITVVVVGRWCGKRSVGGFFLLLWLPQFRFCRRCSSRRFFYCSRDKMEIFVSCQKEESNYAHEKEGNTGRLCIYVDTHSHNDGREHSCCRRCSFNFFVSVKHWQSMGNKEREIDYLSWRNGRGCGGICCSEFWIPFQGTGIRGLWVCIWCISLSPS